MQLAGFIGTIRAGKHTWSGAGSSSGDGRWAGLPRGHRIAEEVALWADFSGGTASREPPGGWVSNPVAPDDGAKPFAQVGF